MQYSEFESQIERLRQVYSSTSLNPERVKVLWDRFKTEKASTFERAVTHLIGEATTQALPAVSRFAEACGFFRGAADRGGPCLSSVDPYADRLCKTCRDDGWTVRGYDRSSGTGIVEPCGCQAGQSLSREAIEQAQSDFDKGARLMRRNTPLVGQPLPYDPAERIGGGA